MAARLSTRFKSNGTLLQLTTGNVATVKNSGLLFTTVVDKAWYNVFVNWMITIMMKHKKQSCNFFAQAPIDTLGAATSTYTAGDGSILYTYTGKTRSDLHRFGTLLQAWGWTLTSHQSVNNDTSVFETYQKGNEVYHLYCTADKPDRLRVAYSDHANLPESPEGTTGAFETAVVQLNLPLTAANEYSNGMGYVVRLADGTFLIFDGGYVEQADQIWNTLVKLHGSEDGVVIRAWCLTHAHGDHYGVLDQFSQTYAKRLTLERFIALPVNASDASDPFFNTGLQTTILPRYDGAVLTVPHTGMVFRFCNLILEILYTADEHLIDGKSDGFDFNSSGTVYRLSGDGDSMLFLGDAMNDVTSRLTAIWGTALESNLVQVSHHGVGNSPVEFYESLHATVLFYPAGHKLYYGPNNDYGQSEAFANNWNRNGAVRKALEESGKYSIYLHDAHAYIRTWGSQDPAAQEFQATT